MDKFVIRVPKEGSKQKVDEKIEEKKSPLKTQEKVLLDTKEDVFNKGNNQNEDASDLMKPSIQGENKMFYDFDDFVDQLGSWKALQKDYTGSPKFISTYKRVRAEYETKKSIYPPYNEVFNAFKHTTKQNIKVVIVGQDPYHQPGQAMGLCFSVKKGIKTPGSLQNMYKELKRDPEVKNFTQIPKHGDLTKWASQGILQLNTVLTVEDSKPNSHKNFGWLDFTTECINIINKDLEEVVFLLWGKPAQDKGKKINRSKHYVLETSHPSGLSVNRGFNGCGHFSHVNRILNKIGKEEIDWNVD